MASNTRSSSRTECDRAATPAVSKALEVSIVVLYVGLLSTTLYGSVVPDYRTAAGEQVGERTITVAAERIERAVPPNATQVTREVRLDLPTTIRGDGYRIRVVESTLVLDHPSERVSTRTELALPESVVHVEGAWSSHDTAVVRVRTTTDGLHVWLTTE